MEERRSLALAAAGISFGAGLIHLALAPAHFSEYWLFGALFLVVALFQVSWAEGVRRRAEHRALLLIGAAANLAVVAAWAVSRTTGLPFGPDPGVAEPIGPADLVATIDELAVALLVAVIVRHRQDQRAALAVPLAWVLVTASLVVALGDGMAGHQELEAVLYLPAFSAT